MAEVVKAKDKKELELYQKSDKKVKTTEKKTTPKKTSKKVTEKKKSLWEKFMIFCHGVKSEFSKVHWPGKKDMVRYSIASIFFIIFCSLFFYLINVIFALVQTLFN